MGKTSDQLPPSEALPGLGEHCVVFHNGNGFYYFCKEFSSCLEKRLFKCVRQDCEVTATMGEGCGSPLIDSGAHCHQHDLTYREKCLLVHNIRQQFQAQDIPAALVLREALSFIEENEDSRTSSPQHFECVTLPTEEAYVELKEEHGDTEIDIIEEDAKDVLLKAVGETMTVDQLLGEMENTSEQQIHLSHSQPTTSQSLQSRHLKNEESDGGDYDDGEDDDEEDYSLTDGSNKRKPRLKPVKPNAKRLHSAQSKKNASDLTGIEEDRPTILTPGLHYLEDTDIFVGVGKNKRRSRKVCRRCYKKTALLLGRTTAKNMTKVRTFCALCPGQPIMCKICFIETHK